MLKRINLNLEEKLLKQLDDYSKEMSISRSAAISVILTQYFQGENALTTLSGIVSLLDAKKCELEQNVNACNKK